VPVSKIFDSYTLRLYYMHSITYEGQNSESRNQSLSTLHRRFHLARPSESPFNQAFIRLERTSGSFSRSFSLANTVKSEAIKEDYKNGVLTLTIRKREEANPKQIMVNLETPAVAAAAAGR
jgi:Hsp20/alpha crystallin family